MGDSIPLQTLSAILCISPSLPPLPLDGVYIKIKGQKQHPASANMAHKHTSRLEQSCPQPSHDAGSIHLFTKEFRRLIGCDNGIPSFRFDREQKLSLLPPPLGASARSSPISTPCSSTSAFPPHRAKSTRWCGPPRSRFSSFESIVWGLILVPCIWWSRYRKARPT